MHFNVDQDYAKKINTWYNGYKLPVKINNQIILQNKYNTKSIMNYLSDNDSKFKPYLENDTAFKFIKPLINMDEIGEIISNLSIGDPVKVQKLTNHFTSCDIQKIKNMKNVENKVFSNTEMDLILSYLHSIGYLTLTNEHNELELPNQETITIIDISMESYYKGKITPLDKLMENLNLILYLILSDTRKEKINENIILLGKELQVLVDTIAKPDSPQQKPLYIDEDRVRSVLVFVSIANFYGQSLGKIRLRTDHNFIYLSKGCIGIIFEIKEKDNLEIPFPEAETYANLIKKNKVRIKIKVVIGDENKLTIEHKEI